MPVRTHRNPYEPDEAEKLASLFAQARKVKGTTPPNHPSRKAGDFAAAMIADRRDSTNPPYTFHELATPIIVDGKPVKQRTLRMFLARRGYAKLPPSQEPYKGVSVSARHRTETQFACGHDRVPDNSYYTKHGRDICRTCQMEANRAYHQARRMEAGASTDKADSDGAHTEASSEQREPLPQTEVTTTEEDTPSLVADISESLGTDDIAELFLEPQEDDAISQATEGSLRHTLKNLRKRNKKLRQEKIASVRQEGRPVACEVCGFDFGRTYGSRGEGYIEVHHATPLHASGPVRTKLTDLVLLCANCHRMIHRGPSWIGASELKEHMDTQRIDSVRQV